MTSSIGGGVHIKGYHVAFRCTVLYCITLHCDLVTRHDLNLKKEPSIYSLCLKKKNYQSFNISRDSTECGDSFCSLFVKGRLLTNLNDDFFIVKPHPNELSDFRSMYSTLDLTPCI